MSLDTGWKPVLRQRRAFFSPHLHRRLQRQRQVDAGEATAEKFQIPYINNDELFWLPNWQKCPDLRIRRPVRRSDQRPSPG